QQAELYAMLIARSRFSRNAIYYLSNHVDGLLYYALQILGVKENRIKIIKSSPSGEIDYADLKEKVGQNGGPAIVCLNAGRLLGAVDDLGKVKGILGCAGVKQKHIHYNMSPLSIGESFLGGNSKIDFEHGVDSMALPLGSFMGLSVLGAIALTKKEYVGNISSGRDRVEYVNAEDTTIPGSRSGHVPLYLWLAVKVMGSPGFKLRARRAIEVSAYINKTLSSKGYPCRLGDRQTLIFKQPSFEVRRKWGLLSYGRESCFEAIPYLTNIEIAEFVNDLLKDHLGGTLQQGVLTPGDIEVSEEIAYQPSREVLDTLDRLEGRLKKLMERFLGFPANITASKESYGDLQNLFKYILRKEDAQAFGQEALDFFTKLYGVEDEDVFSGVTAGGTWGNLIGILAGIQRFPGRPTGILYYSEDSHYSIDKIARLLNMQIIKYREDSDYSIYNEERIAIKIPSLPNGEIDYSKLEKAIKANRGRPVILNLNIGTTMRGAIDSPERVIGILSQCHVADFHIHCDAALSGMMLPFLEGAPKIDLAKSVHSVAISGHKFMGLPMPSGIFMVRESCASQNFMRQVEELLTAQSGQVLFYLWHAVTTKGYEGFRKEAGLCMENAQYLYRKLQKIGCPSELNEFSNTVIFARPSQELIDRWQLAPYGDFVHIMAMQHVTKEKIDVFIQELARDMQQRQIVSVSSPSPSVMAATLFSAIKRDALLDDGERLDLKKFVDVLVGNEGLGVVGEKLKTLKEQMFLEVGCGGRCSIGLFLINRLGFDPAKVHAIEPVMGNGVENFNNNDGRFIKGSIENIPASWKALRFDTIYSALVFCGDMDIEPAADNLYGLLIQTGTLIITGLVSKENQAGLMVKFGLPRNQQFPKATDMYYFTKHRVSSPASQGHKVTSKREAASSSSQGLDYFSEEVARLRASVDSGQADNSLIKRPEQSAFMNFSDNLAILQRLLKTAKSAVMGIDDISAYCALRDVWIWFKDMDATMKLWGATFHVRDLERILISWSKQKSREIR
ncbi:MAG: hypothetical protein KKF80_08020, partial [Candidatus Omnitrophica bacterium]|nr:hypothetical protein [Candidatus Omnitrophota bacterium]